MKVVVGVDGSDQGNQAVRFMNKLLSPKVDDLLLYFSPPEFRLSSKVPLAKGVLEDASRALAEGVFKAANHYLSPEMRSVTDTRCGEGLPCDGLVELTEKENANLVVVGSKSSRTKVSIHAG